MNTLRNIESPLADAPIGAPITAVRACAQQRVCDVNWRADRPGQRVGRTELAEVAYHPVVVGVIHAHRHDVGRQGHRWASGDIAWARGKTWTVRVFRGIWLPKPGIICFC